MEYYSWILAFHVMSVISWMAMLFYLPRLFIYHVEHSDRGAVFTDVIKIQEQKLWKYIGQPAFIASLISGLLMLFLNSSLFESGYWIFVKLFAVTLLIAYHFSLNYFRKILFEDRCSKSGKFFRFYNELPTLLMIIIVIMVVVKPF